jgi:hypothetical protein
MGDIEGPWSQEYFAQGLRRLYVNIRCHSDKKHPTDDELSSCCWGTINFLSRRPRESYKESRAAPKRKNPFGIFSPFLFAGWKICFPSFGAPFHPFPRETEKGPSEEYTSKFGAVPKKAFN